MKKINLLLTLLPCLFAAHISSAQVTTKFGDNVSTLDGIMKAYYDVVTVEKGGKVYFERDSLLHLPGVNVGWVEVDKNGKMSVRYLSLKEYHRLSDPYLVKSGFDEREIARRVEKFGGIYHVWSTYESRNTAAGPIIDRGINSIEL